MLASIVVFYLILGCFMETLSMMITTIPIVAPVMFGLGFDPIWFGIVLIILIEMALITPPVGLNLFVVQSLRSHGTLNDVIVGRSEEHTSELQSLLRISYAVLCLKKKTQ